MANRKVSVLVHDVGSNTVWAATALAQALAGAYDVQVVGPDLGSGICEPYRGAFPYTVVSVPRLYRWPDFWWETRKLERVIEGDAVIAVKAYMDTVIPALRLKRTRGARVVVYLDEWDSANWRALPWPRRIRQLVRDLRFPLNDSWAAWVERKIRHADAVVCPSRFLARCFNGVVIPLGVDTNAYCPQPSEQTAELRRSLGMMGDRLLLFGGVARPHKGLEEILEALVRLGDERIRLVVVGPQTEFLRELQRRDNYARYMVCLGAKPKAEMSRFLAMADLIVLPLQDTPLGRSQVPCKVFEAMAMAKPIIASNVSDLPEILDGCGWIVPPNDSKELARAIQYALAHPVEAAEIGEKARAKCVREFDVSVTSSKLTDLVQRVLDATPSSI
jgi:glycosyltransferase involved in cell wall biosynthesis